MVGRCPWNQRTTTKVVFVMHAKQGNHLKFGYFLALWHNPRRNVCSLGTEMCALSVQSAVEPSAIWRFQLHHYWRNLKAIRPQGTNSDLNGCKIRKKEKKTPRKKYFSMF